MKRYAFILTATLCLGLLPMAFADSPCKSYLDNKQYDSAVQACQSFIDQNPQGDRAWAYYNLGIAYDSLGNFEQSAASYQKAIVLNPQYEDAYYNMGLLYYDHKMYDQALDAYQKALSINPQDADVYNNLGLVYDDQNNRDQAIAQYEKAISINPQYGRAYYNLGRVYYEQGKYDQSVDAYQKSLSLNHQTANTYYGLSTGYYEQYKQADADHNKTLADQKLALAFQNAQTAISMNPSDPKPYYVLGNSYYHQNQFQPALDAFKKYEQLDPKDENQLTSFVETRIQQCKTALGQ